MYKALRQLVAGDTIYLPPSNYTIPGWHKVESIAREGRWYTVNLTNGKHFSGQGDYAFLTPQNWQLSER